jgi:hypothetical protein
MFLTGRPLALSIGPLGSPEQLPSDGGALGRLERCCRCGIGMTPGGPTVGVGCRLSISTAAHAAHRRVWPLHLPRSGDG